MKIDQFDYHLPLELIAQFPEEIRDECKLLVLKENGTLEDSHFYNIHDFLKEGDLLVLNDSRVIKASLTLTKSGKDISINLNKPLTKSIWTGFGNPAKKLAIGDSFEFGGNHIIIKDKYDDGMIEFEFDLKSPLTVFDFLEIYGSIPLPPYIRDGIAEASDEDTYQTIFSQNEGSVAAPTSGLHFTDNVFVQLNKKNIDYCFVTLHVGAGTFFPVKTDNIEDHKMHSEYAEISEETANKINKAKSEGRRIISVGTTSLRTVETSALEDAMVKAGKFETDIFIKPGFDFKIADGLITNFHIPKSTLLILISALAGHEKIMSAYQHAIENKYKFYSYGDAMLIFKK